MADLILPDTNVLITGLAGHDPIAKHLTQWIQNGQLLLSVVTIAEYLSKATNLEEKIFSSLYDQIPILDIDLATAQLAAYFRKKYLTQKLSLRLPDCFLAAQAKISGAAFVTFNIRDFPIPEISVLDPATLP